MKSTVLHIVTALVLAVILFTGFASGDVLNKWRESYTNTAGNTYYILRQGRSAFTDTLFTDNFDTVTVKRDWNSEGISIAFIVDSAGFTAATDTFAAFFRPVFNDTWFGATAGSDWIPLLIRSATGDSTYVLDWEPGAQYWVEDFIPIYAPFLQFLFQTGSADTAILNGVIEQIKVR